MKTHSKEPNIEAMIAKAGGVGKGWTLLPEGTPLQPGDGYIHPDCPTFWIDYDCRPDIFRGCGTKGTFYYVPKNDVAHTWPWRRRGPKPLKPRKPSDKVTISKAALGAAREALRLAIDDMNLRPRGILSLATKQQISKALALLGKEK